jgi:hypothetical protein
MQDTDDKLEVEEIAPIPTEAEVSQDNYQPVEPTGFEIVQDIMGITSPSDEQKYKLQYIWDHYSKGRDRDDAIDAMRAAQRRLGAPEIGETYLHKLYSYTKILGVVRSAQREARAYENGPNL